MTSPKALWPEELLSFLNKALLLQQEFCETLEAKYHCISRADVPGLLEHVRREEALVLRARALDLTFGQLARLSGNPDATVRSLVDALTPPCQEEGLALYGRLLSRLQDTKELVFRCNTLCELRLRRVNTLLQPDKKRGQRSGALQLSKTI